MTTAIDDFDLDRYLRASKRVDLGGIAWERVREHPLTPEAIFCLHYTHTVVYLRDLLATRAIRDPNVTAFLSCCVYEELLARRAARALSRARRLAVQEGPEHVL